MAAGIPARLSPAEGRKFGLTVGGAFIALAALTLWRQGPRTLQLVFASLGGALVLAALVVPTHLGPVQRAWMRFGAAIARVTTPIVTAVLFFGVFTPLGLLARLFGRNPLKRNVGGSSHWVARGPGATRSQLHRQF